MDDVLCSSNNNVIHLQQKLQTLLKNNVFTQNKHLSESKPKPSVPKYQGSLAALYLDRISKIGGF